jgi:hypothetical protein
MENRLEINRGRGNSLKKTLNCRWNDDASHVFNKNYLAVDAV